MVHTTWGIIIACGKSEQLSPNADVGFLNLGKNPVLYYSLDAFERCAEIDSVIIVARKEKLDSLANMVRLFGCAKVRKLVAGTTQRLSTLANGLKALDEDVTIVCVHDASRPCVQSDIISETVKAAKRYGSGVAAIKMSDTVLEAEKGQKVSAVLDRSKLWQTQTPQTFKRELIQKAVDELAKKRKPLEDEASAVWNLEQEVHLVPSSANNMKVNKLDDLSVAAALMKIQ